MKGDLHLFWELFNFGGYFDLGWLDKTHFFKLRVWYEHEISNAQYLISYSSDQMTRNIRIWVWEADILKLTGKEGKKQTENKSHHCN